VYREIGEGFDGMKIYNEDIGEHIGRHNVGLLILQ